MDKKNLYFIEQDVTRRKRSFLRAVAHAILLSGKVDFFKAYRGLFICEV